MPSAEYDLRPVDSIRTGAIGPPGKRVFYLQGRKGDQLVTLIIEKTHVQSLAAGLEQFLDDLVERFPDLPRTEGAVNQAEMELERPIDPAFRVGQIGLGYDEDEDLMVLVAREIQLQDEDPEEAAVARFWSTRNQIQAMIDRGLEIASHGRKICGNCGEPIDPEGHFCPKRNGHSH